LARERREQIHIPSSCLCLVCVRENEGPCDRRVEGRGGRCKTDKKVGCVVGLSEACFCWSCLESSRSSSSGGHASGHSLYTKPGCRREEKRREEEKAKKGGSSQNKEERRFKERRMITNQHFFAISFFSEAGGGEGAFAATRCADSAADVQGLKTQEEAEVYGGLRCSTLVFCGEESEGGADRSQSHGQARARSHQFPE